MPRGHLPRKVRRGGPDDPGRIPAGAVGSILDVEVEVNSDSWGISPWIVQEHIPVLESRFILVPPKELKYGPP